MRRVSLENAPALQKFSSPLSKNIRHGNKGYSQQKPDASASGIPANNQTTQQQKNGRNDQGGAPDGSILRSLDELTVHRIALIVAAGLLIATWYQGCLTKKALEDTEQQFAISKRPYVSLGRKDGTIAEFVASEDPTVPVGIRLYMQNGGQSPALNPEIALRLKMLFITAKGQTAHPKDKYPYQGKGEAFSFITRYKVKNSLYAQSSGGSGTSIPPQSEYIHDSPSQVSLEQYRLLQTGERFLMLFGMLQYCDELGNYTCRQFTLSFNGPPTDAFTEIDEMDCAPLYFYPNPPGPLTTEYLLPCEQTDERNQREKQERDAMLKAAKAAITTSSPTPASTASAIK